MWKNIQGTLINFYVTKIMFSGVIILKFWERGLVNACMVDGKSNQRHFTVPCKAFPQQFLNLRTPSYLRPAQKSSSNNTAKGMTAIPVYMFMLVLPLQQWSIIEITNFSPNSASRTDTQRQWTLHCDIFDIKERPQQLPLLM
jgi:hypothetical protein